MLFHVISELWNIFSWYKPSGKIDYIIKHFITITCCGSEVAVTGGATCAGFIADSTLYQQSVIIFKQIKNTRINF